MPATRDNIRQWFDKGVADGATHMIVKCDTYDAGRSANCCYPLYVTVDEDVREREAKNGDRTMEVYDLRADRTAQVEATGRVFNYGG